MNVANGTQLSMQNNAVAWSNATFKIASYPPYLKGGFFIQQPIVITGKGTEISIVVTGNVKIYVSIQLFLDRSGGFEISLPRNGWKNETGKIEIDFGLDLTRIYSKLYLTKKEKTISLPPTTTNETSTIITVVSISSGN